MAIYENSFRGVRDFVLTQQEMAILDGLDERLAAGRLDVQDGWSKADYDYGKADVASSWDPTLAV